MTRHDCVVVPGLGAFLNLYQPARFDAETMEFHAPSVNIGFNPGIIHNDWLLADSVARRGRCSREAAIEMINDEVRSMMFQLEADGEVALGNLGTMTLSGGLTPRFIPAESGFISSYSGLPSVAVAEVATESRKEEKPVAQPRRRRSAAVSAFYRVAACVAALLVWVTVFVNRSDSPVTADTHYASLDSGLRAYDIIDALFAGERIEAPELLIAKRSEDVSAPVKTARRAAAPVTATPSRLDGDDPYMIIVASFATSAQAEKFLAENSGVHLGIYPADGNYRIYAATAPTLSQAVSISGSPAVKSRFSQAWVLKK